VSIATDSAAAMIGRHNYLKQKLKADIGICALPCAPPHFGLLRYCRRFVCCMKMRKYFSLILIWKGYAVSLLRLAGLAMHQTSIKIKGRRCSAHAKQGGCRVRQLLELLGVRL